MSVAVNASKMFCAPQAFERGLFVGVLLVLTSATISSETAELITGMVGALVVCAMKERRSRRRVCYPPSKCQETWMSSISVNKIFNALRQAEPKTGSFADGMPRCDQDLVQLRASVQAELSALRAECKLENWKLKSEKLAAELAQSRAKVAGLELELNQTNSGCSAAETSEIQIEELLMELAEAKLKAEELEVELAQSHTKMAELATDVAHAVSAQSRASDVRGLLTHSL